MNIIVSSASHVFSDQAGSGESRVCYQLVWRLAQRGHRLHVISPRIDLQEQIEGVTTHEAGGYEFSPEKNYLRYRLNWWRFSRCARRISKEILATERIDLIHHMRPSHVDMFSSCTNLGIPFLYGPVQPPGRGRGQTGWIDSPHRRNILLGIATRAFLQFHGLFAPMRWRRTLESSDIILLQSDDALSVLPHGRGGVKTMVVGMGVDLERYSPDMARVEPGNVLFVSRLIKGKGLDHLLRVIKLVSAKVPNARLTIVGDGPMRMELERLATELSLGDEVQFVGSVAPGSTVEYYRKAAVFCLPSLQEASPNTVMEAMACGVPVVASSTGGIPLMVEDNVTGILVPPADEAPLADALIDLLSSDAKRKTMGDAARQRAEQSFDIDKVVDSIEEAYEKVTS